MELRAAHRVPSKRSFRASPCSWADLGWTQRKRSGEMTAACSMGSRPWCERACSNKTRMQTMSRAIACCKPSGSLGWIGSPKVETFDDIRRSARPLFRGAGRAGRRCRLGRPESPHVAGSAGARPAKPASGAGMARRVERATRCFCGWRPRSVDFGTTGVIASRGDAWLIRALESETPEVPFARATAMVKLAMLERDLSGAIRADLAFEALAIRRTLGAERPIGRSLLMVASILEAQGDLDAAEADAEPKRRKSSRGLTTSSDSPGAVSSRGSTHAMPAIPLEPEHRCPRRFPCSARTGFRLE